LSTDKYRPGQQSSGDPDSDPPGFEIICLSGAGSKIPPSARLWAKCTKN
jgi:hypothetical protein